MCFPQLCKQFSGKLCILEKKREIVKKGSGPYMKGKSTRKNRRKGELSFSRAFNTYPLSTFFSQYLLLSYTRTLPCHFFFFFLLFPSFL